MVKYTGRCLVVKRPGVLSKVQMLNLVLGVGVFSLLPAGARDRSQIGGSGPKCFEIVETESSCRSKKKKSLI